MKIRVVCVGKPKDATWGALHDDYARRIARLGVSYETDWVREIRAGGKFTDDHVREREARSLTASTRTVLVSGSGSSVVTRSTQSADSTAATQGSPSPTVQDS